MNIKVPDGSNGFMTIKIINTFEDTLGYFVDSGSGFDVEAYDYYLGRRSLELARDICLREGRNKSRKLALRQIFGHALGSLIVPEYIDPPCAIWVSSSGSGEPSIIGYSLPFIEGKPTKIKNDPSLSNTSDLLLDYSIYTGNRTESLNAIVNKARGIRKLIDVEVRI